MNGDARLRSRETGIVPAVRNSLDDIFHPPPANIAALDVLRSAAILLVFTGHYLGAFHASPAVQNFPLFRWGWTGVDLFFVLSGLLIGSQLYKELNRTGRIRIGHFLLRRGLRIWPLYYGFVLFAALGYFFGKNVLDIWSDAFCLSNFFHCHVEGGWSISTEEQFYIITPILLSLFALRLSPRRLWVIPCLAIVVLISTRAWVIAHSALPEYALRQKLYFPIFTHADGLAVGVFLAWLVTFHKDRLRSKAFAALASSGMLICGAALYGIKPLLLNFTALGLIYGSLELYGISALPLPRVVRWTGFYSISRLSFGLYLNHLGILNVLSNWLLGFSRRGFFALWVTYFVCLGICLLVAMVTFVLIERPFLVIRGRWLDRAKAAAKPVTPAAQLNA